MILLSFFLFPAVFYYLSPVLVIQAATEGVINGSLLMFLLMFIGSLFLGRAYCGWICPGAGCQEAMYRTRNKRVTKGDSIKWALWVPWIIAIVILAIRAGGYKRVDFLYHTTYGFSIGRVQALISYLIVLLFLIALPAFVFGKRSFCHHICWMAPFMIAGRKLRNTFKWPSLKLAADPEKCQHCHTCTQNCPMSLPVERMINENKLEHKECILCGTCIDGCEFDVIGYAFRNRA
jgi:polyferredoxin